MSRADDPSEDRLEIRNPNRNPRDDRKESVCIKIRPIIPSNAFRMHHEKENKK